MRGNFHGNRLGACLVHLGQKRFQIERLGSGVMRRNLSPTIAVADRADDSRLHSRRGKYRFDQISDRRFTVGPRYTYQFQLTTRPAKKMRRPKPHDSSNISHPDGSRARRACMFFRHADGASVTRNRLRYEVVPIVLLARKRNDALRRTDISRNILTAVYLVNGLA